MNIRFLSYASLFLVAAASAQTGSFVGPVTGYVFDGQTQALRPVLGVPGAATLGAPIGAAYSFTAAYVSPRQDSFFGVASNGSTHWFAIASGAFQETAINGLIASPERVVFSPTGTAAALSANGQVEFVTGLPASPTLAASIVLSGGDSGRGRRTAAALAISDDGSYLLVSLGGAIQLAGPSGLLHAVAQTGADAVMAFSPGSHNAAIAARGTGAILISDVPGAATQQPLANDGLAFNATTGIGFSADGSRVFVASASEQAVVTLDLAGNRSDLPCDCAPSELTPMGSAFRLNELTANPLWLLDAGAAGPRVVFVPALRAAQ